MWYANNVVCKLENEPAISETVSTQFPGLEGPSSAGALVVTLESYWGLTEGTPIAVGTMRCFCTHGRGLIVTLVGEIRRCFRGRGQTTIELCPWSVDARGSEPSDIFDDTGVNDCREFADKVSGRCFTMLAGASANTDQGLRTLQTSETDVVHKPVHTSTKLRASQSSSIFYPLWAACENLQLQFSSRGEKNIYTDTLLRFYRRFYSRAWNNFGSLRLKKPLWIERELGEHSQDSGFGFQDKWGCSEILKTEYRNEEIYESSVEGVVIPLIESLVPSSSLVNANKLQ